MKTISRAVLAAMTALACVAGGCGAGGLPLAPVEAADFDRQVLQSPRPTVVMFYKGGCPTCAMLDPTMETLNAEYGDRVTFYKLMLMTPLMQVTAPELKEKYDLSFYPTVLLLVGGKETTRWVMDFGADNYRKVLDELPAKPAGAPAHFKRSRTNAIRLPGR